MDIQITVNGKEYALHVNPYDRLIDILRNHLELTGTKEGCGIGECGACTVILDGKSVNSCLVMASQIHNSKILTIEGLQENGKYDILQQKFVEHGAIQCGYCTPGMIMSAKALLMENPSPTEEEIRRSMEGNLCRCSGYNKIISAVKEVADTQSGNGHE